MTTRTAKPTTAWAILRADGHVIAFGYFGTRRTTIEDFERTFNIAWDSPIRTRGRWICRRVRITPTRAVVKESGTPGCAYLSRLEVPV